MHTASSVHLRPKAVPTIAAAAAPASLERDAREGDEALDGELMASSAAYGAGVVNRGSRGGGPGSWEQLRKDARKLEGELDMKLASYSKLGARGAGDVSDASADAAAAEIEGLLKRLGLVNDRMVDAATRTPGTADVLTHTLARHRDILQEFSQEFRRVKSTVTAANEHARLLAGAHRRDNIGLGGSGLSQSQIHQQLLRERSGLQSATNAADEVISQAQSQALALGQQRSLLIDIDSKVGSVGQKFPVMNSIMTSIRRKKSREQLILSAVVASCLLFIIIYWMNK